ncbi:MAG: hypothetical protein IJC89_04185 [Clostridia bacterium]|nr:hypothetical protein [Clostridia bacterium]
MEEKKIIESAYELRQRKITEKAKKRYWVMIILSVFLSALCLFEKERIIFGIVVFTLSVICSGLLFFGVPASRHIWAISSGLQLGYYFLNVGLYVSKDYSMILVILMCARSVFLIASSLLLLGNYDIIDIVSGRWRKFKGEN